MPSKKDFTLTLTEDEDLWMREMAGYDGVSCAQYLRNHIEQDHAVRGRKKKVLENAIARARFEMDASTLVDEMDASYKNLEKDLSRYLTEALGDRVKGLYYCKKTERTLMVKLADESFGVIFLPSRHGVVSGSDRRQLKLEYDPAVKDFVCREMSWMTRDEVLAGAISKAVEFLIAPVPT